MTSAKQGNLDNQDGVAPDGPSQESSDQTPARPEDSQNAKSGKGGVARGNSTRGFASMDPARQRQIASEGGRAAHEKGTAHEFSSEEARKAGRKGGQMAHQKGTAHEFDSAEARAAGRKGGQASHSAKRAAVSKEVNQTSK